MLEKEGLNIPIGKIISTSVEGDGLKVKVAVGERVDEVLRWIEEESVGVFSVEFTVKDTKGIVVEVLRMQGGGKWGRIC